MKYIGLFVIVVLLAMMAGCEDDSTNPTTQSDWVDIDGYDFQAYIGDFYYYTKTDDFGDPQTPVDTLDWRMTTMSGVVPVSPDRYAYIDTFSVTALSEDYFAVEWTTTYEVDMLGYHLNRSIKPEFESSHRITSEIIASENQATPCPYRYIDENLMEGFTYYYWLLAYSVDEENPERTGPASIEVGTDQNPSGYPRVYPAYPNSFQDSFTISFSINAPARVIMILVDQDGEVVHEIMNSQLVTGFHNVSVTGVDAEAGELLRVIYYIVEESEQYYGYGDVMVNLPR